MKIVFFGSAHFAVPALKALLDSGYQVSCVVTQPDKQRGRGLVTQGTAVKFFVKDRGVKIYQPQNINAPEAAHFLKGLSADLFIVIAYGHILSEQVLGIPKIFSLNIHASLLPKYRGAAPINWALINGEKTTGVTVIRMVPEMDAGPLLLQKEVEIAATDTALTLEEKLSGEAAVILRESLRLIENKNYQFSPQDAGQASFAPKLKKQDGLISWEKSAQEVYNFIRGCLGWPGAFTYYQGKLLKIYKTKVSSRGPGVPGIYPGQVVESSKEKITVVAGRDNLVIEELQLEGKRRMSVAEFITGHKIKAGDRFGYPTPFSKEVEG